MGMVAEQLALCKEARLKPIRIIFGDEHWLRLHREQLNTVGHIFPDKITDETLFGIKITHWSKASRSLYENKIFGFYIEIEEC